MPKQPEMKDVLSPTQAARLLGVTPRRIRQLSTSGALAFEQTPLGRMYDRSAVERLARRRAAEREARNGAA